MIARNLMPRMRHMLLAGALLVSTAIVRAYDTEVTGSLSGSVWGSGPYTSDSNIGVAAVHAGLISPGQTATIRVDSAGTQSSFPGSTANGVTTTSWNSSWGAINLSLVSVSGGGGGGGGGGGTPNRPATVQHNAPGWVYVGQRFTVTATCGDLDGNLSGMCVRWQGFGIQAYWPLSGSSATCSVDITAPDYPCTINVRAEAVDTLGEGNDSGWQTIDVRPYPTTHAPTASLSFSANSVATNGNLRATENASAQDGDLGSMGIRWQNVGQVGWWAVSGSSASHYVDLTMPGAPGTQYLRGEVWNNAGTAGTAGDWQSVVVVASGVPSVAVTPVAPRQNQAITVNYVGAPDSTTWVGLFAVGAGNSADLAAGTVPNVGSGSIVFNLGTTFQVGQTYEARLFPSNGRSDIARSNSFTIASNNGTYVITVQGGTGGSSAAHTGDVLNLTATPPSGQNFVAWSMYGPGNGTIGNSLSSTTTFTVGTTDATVQALFVLPPPTYLLTVNGGNALPAGPQPAGTPVTITATAPAGQSFASWTRTDTGTQGSLASVNTSPTTFTMGAGPATLQANFTVTDTIAPSAPTNLIATNRTPTTFTLSWTAAADNVGVTGYQVIVGGSPYANAGWVTGTSLDIWGYASNMQFQVRARDAAGNISALSAPLTVTLPSVAPIQLAVQYWRANDYPGIQHTHQESVWQDGWWNLEEHFNQEAYDNWDGSYYHLYDPDGNDTGYIYASYADTSWTWIEGHYEWQTVADGPPQWDGFYGSTWTTTAGTYQIYNSSSGYDPGNVNRGSFAYTYNVGDKITARVWAYAPNNNCSAYSAFIYAPGGGYISGTSISQGNSFDFEFYPSSPGVYRLELNYTGATNTTPTTASVNYYIAVGSLSSQSINFPAIANRLTTDGPFALNATATSGLPVTYTVVAGPATVSGSTVTLTGTPGAVLIRATQNGNSSYRPAAASDQVFGVTAPLPPAAPNGVTATNLLPDKIRIAYNSVTGATGYDVYRATANASSGATKLTTTALTVTSFDDTSAAYGTNYYYWVKAKGVGGDSAFSISAAGLRMLAAPPSVAATDNLADRISVTWAAVTSATGYDVYRATNNDSASSTKLNSAALTGMSYTDTTTTANVTYYYWVRAKIAAGDSAFSNFAAGTRPVSLTPPVALPATNLTGSSFVANWNAMSGATGYQLDVSTNNGFTSFVLNSQPVAATNTSFTVAGAGVTSNTTYYYRVRAENVGTLTTSSNVVTAVTLPVITTQPVAVTTPTNQTVTFTVGVPGTAALTYQWQRNGVNLANGTNASGSTINGATTASLSIANVQTSDAGTYTVVVTNSGGSVTSAGATLTVLATGGVELRVHRP